MTNTIQSSVLIALLLITQISTVAATETSTEFRENTQKLTEPTEEVNSYNSQKTVEPIEASNASDSNVIEKVTPVVKQRKISRALFTSLVQNHEPIDQLNVLSSLISEVFYFTEFKGFEGQTLTHQWLHHGIVSHQVNFPITGKRWRVHSAKKFNLAKQPEGTWTVKILDEKQSVLLETSINYIRASTRVELKKPQTVENISTPAQAEKLESETSETSETSEIPKSNDSQPNKDPRPIWDKI